MLNQSADGLSSDSARYTAGYIDRYINHITGYSGVYHLKRHRHRSVYLYLLTILDRLRSSPEAIGGQRLCHLTHPRGVKNILLFFPLQDGLMGEAGHP